jgi:beta-xylosidase
VTKVRTGLAWSDDHDREDATAWFDRQMAALAPFDVTLTFCFTPEHKGLRPHHTSPPRDPREFADFCARMTRRYAP